MKHLLAGAAAIFVLPLQILHAADPIAILSRNERVVIDAEVGAKQTFVAGVAAARPAFEQELPLVNPPEWGKTLSPGTRGNVAFKRTFSGGFFGRLKLEGLASAHRYLLTFNGRPDLKGNDLLPSVVTGLPDERYFDFLDIESDRDGRYEAILAVSLKPGAYHVRLYVKDTDDWKIVLYRDYFEFTVGKQ
ncbi:MAG TPA: hypothetical protein VGA56_14540 [Opitutaceae bacterium]